MSEACIQSSLQAEDKTWSHASRKEERKSSYSKVQKLDGSDLCHSDTRQQNQKVIPVYFQRNQLSSTQLSCQFRAGGETISGELGQKVNVLCTFSLREEGTLFSKGEKRMQLQNCVRESKEGNSSCSSRMMKRESPREVTDNPRSISYVQGTAPYLNMSWQK